MSCVSRLRTGLGCRLPLFGGRRRHLRGALDRGLSHHRARGRLGRNCRGCRRRRNYDPWLLPGLRHNSPWRRRRRAVWSALGLSRRSGGKRLRGALTGDGGSRPVLDLRLRPRCRGRSCRGEGSHRYRTWSRLRRNCRSFRCGRSWAAGGYRAWRRGYWRPRPALGLRGGLVFPLLNGFQHIPWLGYARPIDLGLCFAFACCRSGAVLAGTVKVSSHALCFVQLERAGMGLFLSHANFGQGIEYSSALDFQFAR